MRKLASIQEILSLESIPGADRIVLAQVEGWRTVVEKYKYRVGDLVVFLEVDSMLNPSLQWVQDHASFMSRTNWIVKTAKLRGVISQGLVVPLSVLPISYRDYTVGNDVTDILFVEKYEVEPFLGDKFTGTILGNFPTHLVSKTDEVRLQSAMYMLDALKGKPYYITRKDDGTSLTALYNDGFVVCTRENIVGKDSLYYDIAAKVYGLDVKLENHPNLVIQGELVGPEIQKNKLGLAHHELHVFNIYDRIKNRYHTMDELYDTCAYYNLKPVVPEEVDSEFNLTLEELLIKAQGKYPGTNRDKEGIVVRPQETMFINGERLSFKVLNNKFLLDESNG